MPIDARHGMAPILVPLSPPIFILLLCTSTTDKRCHIAPYALTRAYSDPAISICVLPFLIRGTHKPLQGESSALKNQQHPHTVLLL